MEGDESASPSPSFDPGVNLTTYQKVGAVCYGPQRPPKCQNLNPARTLLQVRAQVMRRDDSSGGWLPMEGGGLSLVTLYETTSTQEQGQVVPATLEGSSDPKGTGMELGSPVSLTYLITGHRISDNMPILRCPVERNMQYTRANPTFHHWRTWDNLRYGLTFQSPHQASCLDAGVHAAIDNLNNSGETVKPLTPSFTQPLPNPLSSHSLPTITSALTSITPTTSPTMTPPTNQVSDMTRSNALHLQNLLTKRDQLPTRRERRSPPKRDECGDVSAYVTNAVMTYVSPRHHRRYVGSLRQNRVPSAASVIHVIPPATNGHPAATHLSDIVSQTPILNDNPSKPPSPPHYITSTSPSNGGLTVEKTAATTVDKEPIKHTSPTASKRASSAPKYCDTGGGVLNFGQKFPYAFQVARPVTSKVISGGSKKTSRSAINTPTLGDSSSNLIHSTNPFRVASSFAGRCKYCGEDVLLAPAPKKASKCATSTKRRPGARCPSKKHHTTTTPTTTLYHCPAGGAKIHMSGGPPCLRSHQECRAAPIPAFTRFARTITCLRCASCFIFTLTNEEWEDPCTCPPSCCWPIAGLPTSSSSSSSHQRYNDDDDTSSMGSGGEDGGVPPNISQYPRLQPKSAALRWSLLGLLSIILPCLCLYPILKCCHRLGIWCGLCSGSGHVTSTPTPSSRFERHSRPSSSSVSTSTTITIQP